jgi:hypothetical protein
MSCGAPFGAPASTHRTIVCTCWSDSEMSFLNLWMPTVVSRCHGGMIRAATLLRIDRIQGRASS